MNPGSPVCGTLGESVEPSGGGVFVGGSGSQKTGLEALQPDTTSCHCLLPVYRCSVTSQPAAPAAMLPCLDGLYSPGHDPRKPFSPSLFVGMLFHSREKVTKAKIGVECKNLKYCSKDLASLSSAQPTQMPLTSGREISAARKQHYTRLHLLSCQDYHTENQINGHLAWARGCG